MSDTRQELAMIEQREVERLFAGAVLINPEFALEKCGWLKPDILSDTRIKRFWKNMNNGYRGNPLGAALEAGCASEINGWAADTYSSLEVETYANEIQRRAYLVSVDPVLASLLKARQIKDVEKMRGIIAQLYANVPETQVDIPTCTEIAAEFLSVLDGHTLSLSTGIGSLDKATGGLDRRLEYVLAARPSMGKSTLAFQIARNVALKKHKVILFSLEMTRIQLWAKAACGAVEVPWRDVKNHAVDNDVLESVKDASSNLIAAYEDRLFIDDRVHHTTETVWQAVSSLKPDLVVVDVMARLKNRNDSEVRRLGEIVYGLRELAKENNCVMLALHHVNRTAESRTDNIPTLADLRDSGEIEQAADGVFFLWSKDYYDTSKALPRYLNTDVIIAKNREDKRNMVVHLKYDSLAQWFEPL